MKRTLACLGSLSAVAGTVYFSETFNDTWRHRWVHSGWKEQEREAGKFNLSTGRWFGDPLEDRGLFTLQDNRFYDVSASFDEFSNEGKTILLQYQVKYEKDIHCGGAYIKVGARHDLPDPKKFGEPTPYKIMFGPDKCGYTKRTHLIFNYKGKNVLKKLDLPYSQEPYRTSHVYRMVLMPNNTVRVEVDGEKIYEGSIKEDWEVLKPKLLEKPYDFKPDDWIDDHVIDDPTDSKPEDWVEERRIKDFSHAVPEEWDTEEDGEWHPPMKDNPAWKGEWLCRRIKNPVYKGYWEPSMIPNPEFEDADDMYKFEDIGWVGFDLWQVKANTIFDNVMIADEDSFAEADAFLAKWKTLSDIEKVELKKWEESQEEEARKREEEEEDAFDEQRGEEM